MKQLVYLLVVIVAVLDEYAEGHARFMNPISRASRWRRDSKAPTNYNDNQLFCGGFWTQHYVHNSKCGICGDAYGDETPRLHELGGVFGAGVIVARYLEGSRIQVSIDVTANHWGYFRFDICNLDTNKGRETEDCFAPLNLANGEPRYYLPSSDTKVFNVTLQLPKDFACKHCVMRWTYVTGNSWGICDDGSGALGCGAQENFRSCSDVMVFPKRYASKKNVRGSTKFAFNERQFNRAESFYGMGRRAPSKVVDPEPVGQLQQSDKYVSDELHEVEEFGPTDDIDALENGLPDIY